MKSGWGQWLLVVGMSLLIVGSYLTWRSLRTGPLPAGELSSVTEIRDDKPLPAFALQGPRGEFRNANLVGQWNFMFFGYTQCPDICPTALTLMKDVKAALAGKPGTPAPGFQVVFVSVDPQRDTLRLLGEYMAAFDPNFVGITGGDAALSSLVKNLGVYYQRNDATDKQNYTVDHSAAIYLIDPQGRLAAVFSPPQQAAKMATDFRRIAQH
jgi:protein SCO1/2